MAAALAYQALEEKPGVRHIFVYDLGGGTFDTTVIRIDGDDIQVVCTDGNNRLGGADWDGAITDFLLRSFTDQYPQLDPGDDEQFMQDLATSAEHLKRALSATKARKYNMRFDGSVVQVELTREQLEELTSELLERTMEITERTLATAREKGVERFDDVLLVGGMTIMPVIAQTLRERFGLDARLRDPHLAVAKGAALFALMKEGEGCRSRTRRLRRGQRRTVGGGPDRDQPGDRGEADRQARGDGRAPGLRAEGRGRQRPVGEDRPEAGPPLHRAPAHGEYPAARRYRAADVQHGYRQPAGGQPRGVGAGRRGRLGRARATTPTSARACSSDLPPRPAGAPFQVVFHMTEMGLLKVHGREPGSGSEVRFEIQIGGLDEDETRRATEIVGGYGMSG